MDIQLNDFKRIFTVEPQREKEIACQVGKRRLTFRGCHFKQLRVPMAAKRQGYQGCDDQFHARWLCSESKDIIERGPEVDENRTSESEKLFDICGGLTWRSNTLVFCPTLIDSVSYRHLFAMTNDRHVFAMTNDRHLFATALLYRVHYVHERCWERAFPSFPEMLSAITILQPVSCPWVFGCSCHRNQWKCEAHILYFSGKRMSERV